MAEMDYCGPRGIRWDEFVGWPQVSRDAAILWQQQRDQLCRACGTDPSDWDPKRGGHERAYVATIHHCPGCAAIAAKQERAKKGDGLPAGDSVALRRQVPRGEVRR